MNKPLAFITGIGGFAGSHLAEQLLHSGYKVAGALYPGESTANIRDVRKHLSLVRLDIMNEKKCRETVRAFRPDYIFHLAAIASVGRSFRLERLTYDINFDGTLNVLAAALDLKRLKKFVFVSSCDTYGIFTPKTKLLRESQPFNPVSPYGISKAMAEHACMYYYRRYGLPVSIARAFNHSGPRQDDNFVIPSFARQIAMIEAGRQRPQLKVGDLSARRDLSDVRDIVTGYRLLAEKGKVGRVYHLCTGRTASIQQVVTALVKMSAARISVKVDPGRLRKNDIPSLRGDNRRAVQELGYATRYSLNITLKDTLNYWRERILKQTI
ncbi:MAG: GDP-mannose 4,6-dehydratase [candidate division Zixibacteria bacterium]|nr:GDP-mannose 4,6-dehydratase [candidate division Zixibacteria bacterium]